jgi:SAM-dependent methyltransferase
LGTLDFVVPAARGLRRLSSLKKTPGARTFGGDPAAYEAARPGYPPELFLWLRDVCALGPESTCFEIGAGTGQGSRPVLALGVKSILAIEPDAALAAYLADHSAPNVTTMIAKFDDVALRDAAFDFGFAATAFHWVKRMKALSACHAALKPSGSFAMWWNVYHDPASPDAFDAAAAHLFEGLEQSPRMAGGTAFALDVNARLGELRKAGFEGVQHKLFPWEHTFSAAQIASLYGTFSRVQIAPAATRTRLLSEVERIATEEFGGMVRRRIATSAFVGRRP